MQNSEMHYRGFIDACASYGIEKSAADRLYKEAGLGQWGTGIKRGLGAAWGAARRLFGKVKPSQSVKPSVAPRDVPVGRINPNHGVMSKVPAPSAPPVRVVGNGKMPFDREGAIRFQENLRRLGLAQMSGSAARVQAPIRQPLPSPKIQPRPGPTPMTKTGPQPTPQPGAQPKVRDVTRNVNVEATPNASTKVEVKNQPAATTGAAENTAKTEAANAELKKNFWQKIPRPLKWWGNFSAKHPLMGFTMATTPMAGLTAYAMGGRGGEEAAYSRVPTLTPWEMAQYNRMHNGMGLPGLGLDPAMFNMAYV